MCSIKYAAITCLFSLNIIFHFNDKKTSCILYPYTREIVHTIRYLYTKRMGIGYAKYNNLLFMGGFLYGRITFLQNMYV